MAASSQETKLQIAGSEIDVVFGSPVSDGLRELVLDRIKLSAKAIVNYYRRYPVQRVQIDVSPYFGRGVSGGHASGWDGPRIRISVGKESTAADFAEDWVTTHEMVHLAFPSQEDRHHWIEEGQAVYIEPVARARIGELTPEKVWGDMVRDMPQGQPAPGDRGLDYTHTWGRTYWGGAIFCLLADVQIRERTHNQKGLEDALRVVLSEGNIESEWPLDRAIAVGDKATGVPVLHDLYEQMKATPITVDLDGLWKRLGVKKLNGQVVFDDSAPLAAVRRAITAR
ncbi:MAG: hypothetical protein JOZ08_04115 [Verrucomicrobia bacterium]|nr:hypothetical protein [Verrucomicrobiota bacterium]